jgi:hypothetical protein
MARLSLLSLALHTGNDGETVRLALGGAGPILSPSPDRLAQKAESMGAVATITHRTETGAVVTIERRTR